MKKKDITFLRVMHLRGPNIWTYRPVIEAWVDIGAFEDLPTDKLPGFNARLMAVLPGMQVHRCGVGEPGGFFLRLAEGTWMGHVLEHVTIELQNLAGSKVGFGKARQTAEGSGIYKVAVRTRAEAVGRAAIAAARDLIMAMVDDQPFDLAAAVAQLHDLVDAHCLGPSTACIVDAAHLRGIPSVRLNDGNLMQLGYGKYQRRIWTAETDGTSAIAEGIASDKDMTKAMLAACGVPVPGGRVVSDAGDAWEAAQDIGLPVAVKPVDGNHGRGISLDLSAQADIETAFDFAARHGSEVMVERYVPGNEHRLLVVGGRLAAAARGEVLWVTGDGVATIRELVERDLNSDPRRGLGEEFPLNRVNIDDDTAIRTELERQGYTAESVLAAGVAARISRNGNVAYDCTGEVHPEVAARVVLAARVVGLDIAGVDVVAEDISKPLEAQGGAVVEVNAGPGLLMHLRPASGQAQPVGAVIADYLFAPDITGRVPVLGIIGRNGTTAIARLVAWIAQLAGHHVGLSCADGVYLDRRRVIARDGTVFDTAQSVLMNRRVDTVVMEHGALTVLQSGLPYDRCLVGVVTDVSGGPELGEYYIENDDQLFNVLRTQVDVVQAHGAAVLNATDARVLEMAGLCDGRVILYAEDGDLPALAAHRAAGGAAVYWRDGRAVLAQDGVEILLRALGSLAAPAWSIPRDQVLAAIAAARALGISPELIGAGIETYLDSFGNV